MAEPGSTPYSPALLPAAVTSFIGRRSERTQLRTLLAESRLVTLTGFGGVGKTRLALQMATEVRRAFTDGVCFVPLGTVSDPDWLPDSVAAALGLQARSIRAAPTSLVEFLRTRNMLLVLDNCEHLIDAAAVLTDLLLRTCPDVRVLATSREPLRIQGESVHPVPPLSVPTPEASVAAPLQESEGVALFVDRARAIVPGFGLTQDNRQAVAAICRKLEGIPLAIELAVGRLRAMSPTELDQNLTDRWELLSRGSRTAPHRQRTMAACIEWSFDLCSEAERDVWARASVFAEGFELDAAVGVCAVPDDVELLPDVLASLVDKSILIATTRGDRTHFRMLPPIRKSGISRLREKGQLVEYRRRHRDWYVDLAVRANQDWAGPRQIEWIERLRHEGANMRVALEFCFMEPDEAEPGLLMGANLLEFGLAEGLFRPGRVWFDRLLSQPPKSMETRALALRTACWWAAMQGDLEHAAPLLAEGRALAAQVGGHPQTLLTQAAAFVAMFRGEFEEARHLFDEAVEGCREHGDLSQTVFSLCLAGLNCTLQGDFAGARAAHDAVLELTSPVGETWYRSYSLWITGLAAWGEGDITEATELSKESLRLKRLMGERLGIGLSLEALAWFDAAADPERAAMLLGAAQNEWDRVETSTAALPGLHAFHEGCVDQLTTALGADGLAAAWARGEALDPDTAIELALRETSSRRTAGTRKAPTAGRSTVLTPRERQIAQLVSTGLSNQDIASTLVISKRTAETHVEHILTKLGFTSRNQITAWMNEQDGTDSPDGT
jgi:non-specific serine/threonine protein kinase